MIVASGVFEYHGGPPEVTLCRSFVQLPLFCSSFVWGWVIAV